MIDPDILLLTVEPLTLAQARAINQLQAEMWDLMMRYAPDSYRADYECAFCRSRPPTNRHEITHHPDCLGVRLSDAFWPSGGK